MTGHDETSSGSGVKFDGAANGLEVVGDLDGAVGVAGAFDAADTQDFLELFLVGAVVGDGGGGIFHLVCCEDADDTV